MKLEFNRDACQGHNRCYLLAPELFDVDDDGYAIALFEGPIPPDLEKKAQLCADNCPEFAITVAE
jgi:ferredoxin